MKVTIIIPNYNGEILLKKNVPKVIEAAKEYKKETKEQIEIILVDDGSGDTSIKVVNQLFLGLKATGIEYKILTNEKNLGFSSTVNRGVSNASGDIVVLLNTDVAPQRDFLAPLTKHFSDQNIFAVGCMDRSIEDKKVILRGRGIGKWERGFLQHGRGEIDRRNTLWINGGSGAFRKSIWQKLGGFNRLYNPFYYEDIDISYRALKAGFVILFEPESLVVHEHQSGAIKSAFSTTQIKTIAYRNQFIFVWRNGGILLLIQNIIWLPYHVIKAVTKKDSPFIIGFLNACGKLPIIFFQRITDKVRYVKTDQQVIREFLSAS